MTRLIATKKRVVIFFFFSELVAALKLYVKAQAVLRIIIYKNSNDFTRIENESVFHRKTGSNTHTDENY